MNNRKTILNEHPVIFIITLIGLIASVLGIYEFMSGKQNIFEILDKNKTENPVNTNSVDSNNTKEVKDKINKVIPEKPRVIIEHGLFSSTVFLVSDGKKKELCSGDVQDALISPDYQKILVIGNSEIILMNIDGSNYRSYYVNLRGNRLYNRDLTNVIFISSRKFRTYIELAYNDDVQIGDLLLDGIGEYEITFDEFNYLTKIKRIRNTN